MIIWNYEEAVKDIKNGQNFDRKKINIAIKAMVQSGFAKSEIEKEICSIYEEKEQKEYIKNRVSYECKKNRKEDKKIKEKVNFTETELQKIVSIVGKDAQKVLFCMFTYCKSRGVDFIYFCSRSEVKPKDIMEATKIPNSTKRFNSIMRELYCVGAIEVEPNMKVRIKDIDFKNEEGHEVQATKNACEWLDVYVGRGVFCHRCGVFVKRKGNNKKYCPKCAEIAKKEKDKIRKLKN